LGKGSPQAQRPGSGRGLIAQRITASEAAQARDRLDKLYDEADDALDFDSCDRLGAAIDELHTLIAATAAATLAGAALKLRRVASWLDAYAPDREPVALRDVIAVIEREIAPRGWEPNSPRRVGK
jgi:hypothetical protein